MTLRSFIVVLVIILLYGGGGLHAQVSPCDSVVGHTKYYLLFLQNGPDLDATATALRPLGYTGFSWDSSPLSWIAGVGIQYPGRHGILAIDVTGALGSGGGRYSDTAGYAYALDADLLHGGLFFLYGYPLLDTGAFAFYPLAGLGFAGTDLTIRRRPAGAAAQEGVRSIDDLVAGTWSESFSKQRFTLLADIGVGIESRFDLSSAGARDRVRLVVGFRGGYRIPILDAEHGPLYYFSLTSLSYVRDPAITPEDGGFYFHLMLGVDLKRLLCPWHRE